MTVHVKTTKKKKNSRDTLMRIKHKKFIELLAETGQVKSSAMAVGYSHAYSLYNRRKEDPDFAAEWDLALETAASNLEEEAQRRAVEGVKKPVYYRGEVVGHTLEYSDGLLMFLLRGLRPNVYRENSRGGDTNINFGVAVLPMTAKNEDQWEQRALEMHQEQDIITLEDKPTENVLERMTRGD